MTISLDLPRTPLKQNKAYTSLHAQISTMNDVPNHQNTTSICPRTQPSINKCSFPSENEH